LVTVTGGVLSYQPVDCSSKRNMPQSTAAKHAQASRGDTQLALGYEIIEEKMKQESWVFQENL
jgi:hypothetical protein